MASGMQDYQSIFRPKYGAAQAAPADVVAVATSVNPLVLVLGKGVIYGGALGVFGGGAQSFGVPIIKVDGASLGAANLQNLIGNNFTVENCYPFYARLYDHVNFIYSVGISSGITFETSFEVEYEELDGGTPVVWSRIIYALI